MVIIVYRAHVRRASGKAYFLLGSAPVHSHAGRELTETITGRLASQSLCRRGLSVSPPLISHQHLFGIFLTFNTHSGKLTPKEVNLGKRLLLFVFKRC